VARLAFLHRTHFSSPVLVLQRCTVHAWGRSSSSNTTRVSIGAFISSEQLFSPLDAGYNTPVTILAEQHDLKVTVTSASTQCAVSFEGALVAGSV
jgi:hypothetical protein